MRSRVEAIALERRRIHDEAGDDALDEAQQQMWVEMDEEEARLAPLIVEIQAREERDARVQESRARWQSQRVGVTQDPFDQDIRTLNAKATMSRALTVLDSPDGGRHLRSDQKEKVERSIRHFDQNMDGDTVGKLLLATERPGYRSAFQQYITTPNPSFSREEARAIEEVRLIKRALSIGTDGSGGYAVPVLIDPTIIMTAQGSNNDILRLARLELITNDVWRGISTAGVSWTFRAEAAEAADNAPTIAAPEITARRADGFIPYSIEIGMDWPGFAESMSGLLSDGWDELLAEKLTTGTNGSNEPDGLITSIAAVAGSKREAATAGAVAAADVYALWDALPQRHRRGNNVAWMSSTDIQNSIRQLGTVDPNFSVNITEESIGRLFGREYPVNDFMADDPTGTGTQSLLVLGDFSQYVVAMRAGMSVELLPHLLGSNRRPTGQRGLFAWARVGGGVVSTNAFRLLTNRSA
jgi:HK97 family phage major capsid protein